MTSYMPTNHITRMIGAAAVLAIVLLLGLPIRPAYACTPPPGGLPTYTTAEYVEQAGVVLEGVVEDQYTEGNMGVYTATVRVDRYFKVDGSAAPAYLTISGYGPSSVCLSMVGMGDHLIFFASGDPATGALSAFYLSQFDAVHSVSDDYVAEILAATNTEPVIPVDDGVRPPAASGDDTETPPESAGDAGAGGLSLPIRGAIFMAFLLLMLAWRRRRRRR